MAKKEQGAPQEPDLTSMTEEEIAQQVSTFSYDLKTCGDRLKAGDDWQRVIQAHLFFDHVINRLISEEMKNPNEINLDRMSFAAKIDLATSLGLIGKDFKGLLKKVNSLRNEISHDLNFVVTAEHAEELFKLSPPPCRILIDEDVKNGDTLLHRCLLTDVIMLDIIRQHHAARRMIQKKQYLRLKAAVANAKRVLTKTDGRS